MAFIGDSLLLTGGRGRLGRELRKYANFGAPDRHALNILSLADCEYYCAQQNRGGYVVHAAALVSTMGAEKDQVLAWELNVEGTRNMVRAAQKFGQRFVYISTDYVFSGNDIPEGGYHERSIPDPINFYGLTKLVGEEIAQTHPNSLVIRAPFRYGPPWPYGEAFTDQYTSARFIAEVAPEIVKAALSDLQGIIHIGGPKRSIYEMAVSVSPEVLPSSCCHFPIPKNVALNSTRWHKYAKEIVLKEFEELARVRS